MVGYVHHLRPVALADHLPRSGKRSRAAMKRSRTQSGREKSPGRLCSRPGWWNWRKWFSRATRRLRNTLRMNNEVRPRPREQQMMSMKSLLDPTNTNKPQAATHDSALKRRDQLFILVDAPPPYCPGGRTDSGSLLLCLIPRLNQGIQF